MDMNALVEAVARAVEKLKVDGIEGWGLKVPDELKELGMLVEISPASGCTSDTCNHFSHDPAAPVVKWVPKEGRLVLLGKEEAAGEVLVGYYALLRDGGVMYVELVESRSYWDKVRVIQEDDVPAWALASAGELKHA